MCYFKKPPELSPLPAAPTANDDSVRRAKELEAARLAAGGGTASTVKTDMAPASIATQKRVLLGQ
jgi:hypothetical protein